MGVSFSPCKSDCTCEEKTSLVENKDDPSLFIQDENLGLGAPPEVNGAPTASNGAPALKVADSSMAEVREAAAGAFQKPEDCARAESALTSIIDDVCDAGGVDLSTARKLVLDEWRMVVQQGQQEQFLGMLEGAPSGSTKRKWLAKELVNVVLRKTPHKVKTPPPSP
jgi:hypothetical protein